MEVVILDKPSYSAEEVKKLIEEAYTKGKTDGNTVIHDWTAPWNYRWPHITYDGSGSSVLRPELTCQNDTNTSQYTK